MFIQRAFKAALGDVPPFGFRIVDFAVALGATAVVLYLGLSLNIFTDAPGQIQQINTLELNELLALATIFLAGMLWAIGKDLLSMVENIQGWKANIGYGVHLADPDTGSAGRASTSLSEPDP